LDQRFHSLDGFIIANLIPSNNSNLHEIISKDRLQQSLSKNDLVKVSSKNPITLKSKILADDFTQTDKRNKKTGCQVVSFRW
jgi:hypothetical protein